MTEQFSRPGAIDLSGFARTPAGAAPTAGGGGSYVVDVTEANFAADVVDASMQHLVVLALYSPRSPESMQVTDLLARLADTYEGRFLLARVDTDAAPQIAQAVGAQDVPFVVALLSGQPVAQVPVSTDETESRGFLDQLTQAAVANGVTGRAQPRAAATQPADEVQPDDDNPRFAEADAALAAGDYEGAVAAYTKLVAANPGDRAAVERMHGVDLMRRLNGVDETAARAAAADNPTDAAAQTMVADLDVMAGRIEDAFARLIDLVVATEDAERDSVRTHLIGLFDVVGLDDMRVLAARRALANALF